MNPSDSLELHGAFMLAMAFDNPDLSAVSKLPTPVDREPLAMSAHAQSIDRDVYRVAVEASPSPMLVTDAAGTIVLANAQAERLFGWDAGQLVGRSIDDLLPDELRAQHAELRAQFVAAPVPRPMGRQRDLQARRKDGSVFPVEVGLNPVPTADGVRVVCAIVDLTERLSVREQLSRQAALLAEANAKLTELATTDDLTALWNRRAFLEQLDLEIERAVRDARSMSVLILDVDHFKSYNDEYGHLAGDEVLGGVARVLREHARRSDFLARIGGEEFGILLHAADRAGAMRLAERFRVGVERTNWPRRPITVSVGAATVTFHSAVPRPPAPGRSKVLAAADRALYHSKEHGRNRVTHVQDLAAS